ncbi:GNAT family N-acetyltransferase [Brachybacterium sp. UMB0905]|uniref:GNAT family N-acetyltransferase n=1 Tax=Brachybacterium sp. UMB0905 TaxID=2069310 RepID=UPI000C7FCBCA|nr:GNAT family N-acetyltransferase [Brachybacterium sp. UMB0905]PMC74479.1 hypothetical protein CJ197_13290 [Brachybacterium sp. UMB0905]
MNDGAASPSLDGGCRAVRMSGDFPLVTARLRLDPVGWDDLAELLALHRDPRVFTADSTAPVETAAQMRWVLGQWITCWERHGTGYLTVRARGGGEGTDGPLGHLPEGLLGVVGISLLRTDAGAQRSAYWRLAPSAQGRGVAAEAMRAVLAHPTLGGARRVIAVTAGGNAPSRALALRLGFRPAPADAPVPGGRSGDVLLIRDP